MTETSSQEKFTQTLEGIIEQYSISEPPEFLKVLTALPNSPDKDKMFEDMDEVFRTITSPSELSSKLPKGTAEDPAAKELAKIPDSQKILSEEQQKMVELFIEMLSSSSSNESQIDMDYVRRFANTNFPLSSGQLIETISNSSLLSISESCSIFLSNLSTFDSSTNIPSKCAVMHLTLPAHSQCLNAHRCCDSCLNLCLTADGYGRVTY